MSIMDSPPANDKRTPSLKLPKIGGANEVLSSQCSCVVSVGRMRLLILTYGSSKRGKSQSNGI
jgi:hypothetical protein